MKTRRMFSRESGPNPFSMRTVRMATVILLVALLAGPARASPSLISPARLLVIAPHPDDETLAAGGLIYSASKQGAKVKVVFITMGDGYHLAASALRDIACPSPDDFLALGNHRRKEGIAALAALGVSDRDVVFLGYPDRGGWPTSLTTGIGRRTSRIHQHIQVVAQIPIRQHSHQAPNTASHR